jgi:hypothetical protein
VGCGTISATLYEIVGGVDNLASTAIFPNDGTTISVISNLPTDARTYNLKLIATYSRSTLPSPTLLSEFQTFFVYITDSC